MESAVASPDLADEPAAGNLCRYSLRQVAELAHVPLRRLRAWVRAGLIEPIDGDGQFTFRDVRAAGLLMKLSRNGLSTAQLQRIASQLRHRFPDANGALSQLELMAGLLVIRDAESRLTDVDGQLLLELAAGGESSATVALRMDAARQTAHAADAFERAVALEADGKLEQAADAYRECLRQSGPDLAACFNLANILAALGRTEAAAERYWQAVEIEPSYAAAWNNLGLCLAERGEQRAAIDAWKRAVEIEPDFVDALFNLADALHASGETDTARPLWKSYLRLDDKSEWASYARYCLNGAA